MTANTVRVREPLQEHPLGEGDMMRVERVEYRPTAMYVHSAGQAYSVFLRGLKDGKILGRRCRRCRRVYVPPRMYCEDCFRDTEDWVEVGQVGVVMTAVASFVSWTREKLETPEVVGVIRLQPSSPRDYVFPGLFHRINATYQQVKDMSIIGKKVKAVWVPKEKRVGSINDILHFSPIEEVG